LAQEKAPFGAVMLKLTAGILVALLVCGCADSRDELLKELMSSSPVKRAGALRILAQEGDEEAYLLVSQALEDQSAVVRIAAVRALAIFRGRDTTAALVRATRDADPEVREAAVACLAARRGEAVRHALVNMLLRAERSPRVRRQIYQALEAAGLSGRKLAEEMASRQMEMIRQEWKTSRGSRRAQLVRLAGRSVHPDAMRVVLEGLADKNVDVVLSALSVLDGRGGKAALRQLLMLASDQSVRIRLKAVQALRHYGRDGLAVLGGVLRDLNSDVRLQALKQLGQVESDLSPEMLCPLLLDTQAEVLVEAARLIRAKGVRCDLSPLAGRLADPEDEKCYSAAIRALSILGGEPALKILSAQMKKQPASLRPVLAAAMAHAGDRGAKLRALLEKELRRMLEQFKLRGQGWVTGKLPPRKQPQEEPVDHTRLSEEELKKLYEKHGLPPAGKDAPRGISDILEKYQEPSGPAPAREIFEAVTLKDVEVFTDLLQGLAEMDLASAASVAGEALGLRHPELAGRVARLALDNQMALDLEEELIGRLGELMLPAGERDAGAIADLLATTKRLRAVEVLSASLAAMPWEKREHAISALGRLGFREGIEPLVSRLKGYSAASAARALGEIGDPAAVEPLREALKSAGPSAEMDIFLALSKLGFQDIVPMLSERLGNPDPEVRRAAVRILGILGGAEARSALEAVRFDLDRLVRVEAGNYLKE
jgi:HEAT repeat protein